MSKKLIFILGGLALLTTAIVVTRKEVNEKPDSHDDPDISYKALGHDYDEDSMFI